jgi:hypothetical protein
MTAEILEMEDQKIPTLAKPARMGYPREQISVSNTNKIEV